MGQQAAGLLVRGPMWISVELPVASRSSGYATDGTELVLASTSGQF